MNQPFGPAVQAEDGENENRVRQPGLEFRCHVQRIITIRTVVSSNGDLSGENNSFWGN